MAKTKYLVEIDVDGLFTELKFHMQVGKNCKEKIGTEKGEAYFQGCLDAYEQVLKTLYNYVKYDTTLYEVVE